MPNLNAAKAYRQATRPKDLSGSHKQHKLGGVPSSPGGSPLTRSPLPAGGPAPRAAAQAEDGDFTGAFLHPAASVRKILAGTRELREAIPGGWFCPVGLGLCAETRDTGVSLSFSELSSSSARLRCSAGVAGSAARAPDTAQTRSPASGRFLPFPRCHLSA